MGDFSLSKAINISKKTHKTAVHLKNCWPLINDNARKKAN